MKIELKNIKHMPSLSEETECYSASLYVDGKKIGDVSNRGHGGPDEFFGDREAFKQAEKWLAENMAPVELGMETDRSIPMDMELYCGQLLEEHLVRKDLKSALKNKVLFSKPGEKGIFEVRWKGLRKIEDRHISAVREKHPAARILNEMPFEEALKLYREKG